jgi:1-acyl-sn-glycerol-3-phosphate acyltransferase
MMSPAATETVGVCVLAVVVLLPIAFLAYRARRLSLTWHQRFWWGVNQVLCRVLWRAAISGPLPIGPNKGALVICNHRSPIDPCFIELGTHRAIHWLIAKEYCNDWKLGWFLRMCEVIPTNRAGVDTAATKMAIRLARNGNLVGLFPEGRLNTTEQVMLSGRPGVALIALKAGVPVIPCYIEGSPYDGTTLGALLMHARVKVTVGRPIDVSEYRGREGERGVLEELTRRLMQETARLGGHPDFEPELAGRSYRPE